MQRVVWLACLVGVAGCDFERPSDRREEDLARREEAVAEREKQLEADERAAPPKAETPKAETPKPEAASEAPKAEAPKAEMTGEAPAAEPPKAELSKRETPKTEAPKAEAEKKTAAKDPKSPKPAETSQPEDASDRLTLKGDPIQGGLVFAKVDGEVAEIKLPGHRAVVDDEGRFLIGFARTAPPKETMTIRLKDGTVIEHVFRVGQRTFTTEAIEVPDEEVAAEGAEKKQKAASDAKIHAARMKHSKDDCWSRGFDWPAKGRITSRYGFPRVINGKEGGVHWGVDIAVPVGTAVKAPACGEVVYAEEDVPLAGTTVVIDHGGGLTSTFLHLAGITKKVGERVEKGEPFAKSGKSGRATGPHLDWRMNLFDIRVDPELLVPPKPAT
jgi:murein DD-endopeptidase MepM/ murein hydrolase activator NlpD